MGFWNSPALKKKKEEAKQKTNNARPLTFATLKKKALFRGDRQVFGACWCCIMKCWFVVSDLSELLTHRNWFCGEQADLLPLLVSSTFHFTFAFRVPFAMSRQGTRKYCPDASELARGFQFAWCLSTPHCEGAILHVLCSLIVIDRGDGRSRSLGDFQICE